MATKRTKYPITKLPPPKEGAIKTRVCLLPCPPPSPKPIIVPNEGVANPSGSTFNGKGGKTSKNQHVGTYNPQVSYRAIFLDAIKIPYDNLASPPLIVQEEQNDNENKKQKVEDENDESSDDNDSHDDGPNESRPVISCEKKYYQIVPVTCEFISCWGIHNLPCESGGIYDIYGLIAKFYNGRTYLNFTHYEPVYTIDCNAYYYLSLQSVIIQGINLARDIPQQEYVPVENLKAPYKYIIFHINPFVPHVPNTSSTIVARNIPQAEFLIEKLNDASIYTYTKEDTQEVFDCISGGGNKSRLQIAINQKEGEEEIERKYVCTSFIYYHEIYKFQVPWTIYGPILLPYLEGLGLGYIDQKETRSFNQMSKTVELDGILALSPLTIIPNLAVMVQRAGLQIGWNEAIKLFPEILEKVNSSLIITPTIIKKSNSNGGSSGAGSDEFKYPLHTSNAYNLNLYPGSLQMLPNLISCGLIDFYVLSTVTLLKNQKVDLQTQAKLGNYGPAMEILMNEDNYTDTKANTLFVIASEKAKTTYTIQQLFLKKQDFKNE